MKLGDALIYIVTVGAWVAGIAVAKGFWMTLLCALFAPAAWVVFAGWCLA